MIDSSREYVTGGGDTIYEVYKGMIGRSQERTPSVAITATYAKVANVVTIKATVTNLSSTTLSVQNKAAVHAIVYEDYRASKTDHAGRGSAKTDITYLRPGRSETFMITVNLSGVIDPNNLHYLVTVDYKTTGTNSTGVYDQLQAAFAVPGDVTPPTSFVVSPASFSFDIKTADVDMPTGQIELSGTSGQTWTASVDQDFVQINETQGSLPATINMTIDKSKLEVGTQSALILVSDGAGLYERGVLVTVNLSLSAFNVTPTSVTFNFSSADPTPSTSVLPKGAAGQTWVASANKDWVIMTPSSGQINSSFNISVDPAKLETGYQEAIVTVSDGGGYQSKTVKVKVYYSIVTLNYIYLPMILK